MTDNEIKLPHHIAEIICKVECVSQGEGIGPDMTDLLSWIAEKFPDLKEKYSYLEWPKLEEEEKS
ncbi:hypothetical protein KAR91_34355 [Candidatus Pacearchaeota archaeon]|nr:hypothetical protein [Candidatus Pacearchaeota archaeon]